MRYRPYLKESVSRVDLCLGGRTEMYLINEIYRIFNDDVGKEVRFMLL